MFPLLPRARCARLSVALFAATPLAASAAANAAAPSSSTAVERDVSLAELLEFAARNAPAARLAARRERYGEAARAGAEPLLRHNPSLQLGAGPRFGGSSARDYDLLAALTQPVEIGGQRASRLEAASRRSARLQAEALSTRWQLRRDVTLAYRSTVVARERAAIEQHLLRFAEEMTALARKRFAAGELNAIELRVAEVDLARARQSKLAADQALRSARLRLAELSGWSLEHPPRVSAGLELPPDAPALEDLLKHLGAEHPELRARRAARAEAEARAELAEREAWPTPVLGVQFSREGSVGSPPNHIVLGTVEVPVPLWQRNREARIESRVDVDVARTEESAAARALHAEVARAHAELGSARERLSIYTTAIAPQLEESFDLLRRGFVAGEVSVLDLGSVRERWLGARRDALAAYADYYRAATELEFALGIGLGALGSGAP